ncbi:MAG TPA: CHRD domain-containing protein [Thermoleophilia bacterium]|nr:CHRD domain-containing protein [Thermoleophilia bacterium]
MRKISLVLLIVIGIFALVGCSGDDETTTEETEAVEPSTTEQALTESTQTTESLLAELVVPLNPDEVVPPVDLNATGSAVFRVDPQGEPAIEYEIFTQGAGEITAAHIHVGAMGENGPPIIWLYPPERAPGAGSMDSTSTSAGDDDVDDGTSSTEGASSDDSNDGSDDDTSTTVSGGGSAAVEGDSLVRGRLTQTGLQQMESPMSLQELLAMLAQGNTYVQIHTQEYPDGALRGQVVFPELQGVMDMMGIGALGGMSTTDGLDGSTGATGSEMDDGTSEGDTTSTS